MPATDAFIGPQPLHRIPTPQSASQNVCKIADQFQYPPCVLRASQKHTYGSLSVVQLAGGSPIISSSCLYAQAKTEYNVSTKHIGRLVHRTGCQGNSPAKKNLKPKMVSILDTLFGVSLSTDKKDGKQKPKPKMASKNLSYSRRHGPWNMKIPHNSQMASLHISCNQPPLPAPTARLQFPDQKFSPSLRDIKTWDCRVRTVFFEHLRSIHIEACLWFSWLGKSPISSACLYVQAKTEYNVSTKILVPRNQPSKEKSEAKNGFNFGYTFWRLFKYRQEGREAKTEAKNGFEKASPIPAAMGHGTWRFHTIRRWRVFTSVATDFHYPHQQRGCNSRPKIFPNPTGRKDLRLQGTHWGGPWAGLCFHGTFAKLLFASSMWQSAGFGQLAD